MKLIETLVCAGVLLAGGAVIKRMYDHQQFLAWKREQEESKTYEEQEMNKCFNEIENIINEMKRRSELDPVRIESMKLVKEHGMEEAVRIRWEEMKKKG